MKGSTTSVMSTREMRKVEENLSGICNAIVNYGLVLDREIRTYVRGRTEGLVNLVRSVSKLEADAAGVARSTLARLAGRYSQCDPVLAAEMRQATGF